LLPNENDNKGLEKEVIKVISNFLKHIGVISVYLNDSSLFWMDMGFILEETGIYLTLK
jgi:hypothetical protein